MLRNEPDDRTIRLALAENHRRLGRLAEAEAALAPLSPPPTPTPRGPRPRWRSTAARSMNAERLLAEGPSDHPALARLRGRLALGRGDAAAVDHYRAALAAEPDDRDTLFGLGQSLRVAGTPLKRRPYLEAARARDHLEWLIQNARSSFERDDPKVLAAIGDACLSLGGFLRRRAGFDWRSLATRLPPAFRSASTTWTRSSPVTRTRAVRCRRGIDRRRLRLQAQRRLSPGIAGAEFLECSTPAVLSLSYLPIADC